MAAESTQALLATELVPSGQLVTFTLDNVEFGLDIDRVQEITHRTDVTPVPGSPSFILGVINLRGLIIPVIDSRVRFHLAPMDTTAKTRIIDMRLASGSRWILSQKWCAWRTTPSARRRHWWRASAPSTWRAWSRWAPASSP